MRHDCTLQVLMPQWSIMADSSQLSCLIKFYNRPQQRNRLSMKLPACRSAHRLQQQAVSTLVLIIYTIPTHCDSQVQTTWPHTHIFTSVPGRVSSGTFTVSGTLSNTGAWSFVSSTVMWTVIVENSAGWPRSDTWKCIQIHYIQIPLGLFQRWKNTYLWMIILYMHMDNVTIICVHS